MGNFSMEMETLQFDEKTQAAVGYYVYMLINPEDKKPFYVGKGKGNRVFQHIQDALNSDIDTEKCDVIRDIISKGNKVEHIIICHGINNESEAYKIEAAVIDSLNFYGCCLTNAVNGHHSAESGLMTANEIKRLYSAESLNCIGKDCVIININGQYSRGMGHDAIYGATKEIWRIGKDRIKGLKYVLSEYRGLIIEVFKVDEWYPKERPYNSNSKKAGQTYTGYGFNGHIAEDEVRNKYINKSITHKKVKGRSNPISYTL